MDENQNQNKTRKPHKYVLRKELLVCQKKRQKEITIGANIEYARNF